MKLIENKKKWKNWKLYLLVLDKKYIPLGIYPDRLRDRYTGLDAQTLAPKKDFSRFVFSVVFNKKYVEVAITGFTIHIIILKWFRRQKWREDRKIMRQKTSKWEKKLSGNAFLLI